MEQVLTDIINVVEEWKWTVTGCLTLGGLYCVVKRNRRLSSYLCHLTKQNVNEGFRQAFNEEFVFNAGPSRDASHSHPLSSRLRTDAERSIDDFLYAMGRVPYSISTSARDNDGQRFFYSAKDVDLPYRNTSLRDNHVCRMIDVDYYADLEYWLSKGKPIILYTFVPESVGGPIVEGVFSVDNDVATVLHDGGGRYQHKFWDYNVDHFTIKGWFKNLMVKVDQVRVPGDVNRRIVCLTPRTWYWRIFDWMFDSAPGLRRRRFTYGDANLSTYQTTVDGRTRCMVSLALRDTPTNVSIDYPTFVGICKRLAQSKHPNVSDVERYLIYDKTPNAPVLAPIIYEAFEGGWYKSLCYRQVDKIVSCGPARTAPHYQSIAPLVTEDGHETGVVVWQPIVTGAAVFPRRSYNNDSQAVVGRVESIANRVEPKGRYHMYFRDFVENFPVGACIPVSMSDVIEQQNKPAQRIRCEANKMWCRHQPFKIRAFMKKETYGKVTDPRNISTCTPSHTMTLSTYTYAAKKIFKQFNWFIPGRNPKEIADMVRKLVSDRQSVLSCDYSRLDGTISKFLRNVEKAVYLRLFPVKYHEELRRLLESEVKCRATTSTGMSYDPGYSRLSGSPLTTDGNTIIVAFVAYCAMRDAGLIEKDELDRLLAMVYGDDKLVVGVDEATMERTARNLGLTLKCVRSERNTSVEFLARVFVDPWLTLTSIQSPLRTLGKLHMSSVRSVAKEIVARNKAQGYLVTDRLTPLIRDYCLHVVAKTPEVTTKHLDRRELQADLNYWAREFPNESWPQEIYDEDLMLSEVAKGLNVPVTDVLTKIDEINSGEFTPFEYQLAVTIPAVITPEDVVAGVPSETASSSSGGSRRRRNN